MVIFHHVLGGANLNYANCFLVQCDNEIGCQAEQRESYYTYERGANIITTTAPTTLTTTTATIPPSTVTTSTTTPTTTVRQLEYVLETTSNADKTPIITTDLATKVDTKTQPKSTEHVLKLISKTPPNTTTQVTLLEIDKMETYVDDMKQITSSYFAETTSSGETTTIQQEASTLRENISKMTTSEVEKTSKKQYETSVATFPIYPNETLKDRENVQSFHRSYGMLVSIVIFGFLMAIATAYIWLKNCREITYKKYHEVTFMLYDDEIIHQNA